MLRWWRIVANHPIRCTTSSGLHASAAPSASGSSARLRTAHLLGPGAAQQRLDRGRARRLARDEDPELVVRKPRIVGDRTLAPGGEQRVERDPQDRRKRAE